MSSRYFTTFIKLPQGVPAGETLRRVLRLIFDEYRWFRPVRYGFASLDKHFDTERIDYDRLITLYEELKAITIAAQTDRDFVLIFSAKSDDPPCTGQITWETSVREAVKASWRAAHLRQVAEVMRLVGSPLAHAGLDEDFERKTRRLVPAPDGVGQVQELTVRDYSEGLAGLFWRNFFGAPFVRLFGERLESVPGEFRTDLDGGIVLVQPYELPTQAGTPEGEARERELIARLGPECFYDHERHLKPTRLPELLPRGAE